MRKNPSNAPMDDKAKTTERFQKAVQGDTDAFWALIEPYSGLIYSIALGIMKDHETAAGIMHEVYLKAFRSLNNLRYPTRIKTWLHSLTRNMCYDLLRKKSRQKKNMPEVLERRPRVVPIIEVLVKEEELKQLEASLNTLPEPFRVILGMKYMSDMSCGEISETLDISVPAVKSRLYEARKLLANRMTEERKSHQSRGHGGRL